MTTYAFRLNELPPTRALEVLATVGPEVLALCQGGTGLHVATRRVLGLRVQLVVPDPYLPAAAATMRPAFEKLTKVLDDMTNGVQQERMPVEDTSLMPLDQALAFLLLYSGSEGDPAVPEGGEHLLLARHLTCTQFASLFEDLRFHGTNMVVAEWLDDHALPSYAFHIRDDVTRRSSLQSFEAGGGLDGVVRLAAFRASHHLVFLPLQYAPSRQALQAFCTLAVTVPGLLRLSRTADKAERLVAITLSASQTGQPTGTTYPLAHLDFIRQAQLVPSATAYASLEMHDLHASAEALQTLRAAIMQAQPHVGYRLELRPGYRVDGVEVERLRMRQQLAELDQKLSYMNSLQEARPVLLRFTQRQLPALADAIRCFPPADINAGLIQYGFQATDDGHGAWHYLFFDPRATVMTEPYPEVRWERLDDSPRRFWLDPSWARYYHDQAHGNTCLVFVPEGTALFPTLHSWGPDDMDKYMREVMGSWFHGHAGVQAIPEHPIYLFDGVPQPDAPVRVQVLDRAAFQPLHLMLGWLNDHLCLLDTLDVHTIIEQMATSVRREALATQMERNAQDAEARFTAMADRARDTIVAEATELTTVLTSELTSLATQARETHQQITVLHGQLRFAEEVLQSLQTTQQQLAEVLTDSAALGEKYSKEFQEHLKQINQAITTANNTHSTVTRQVEAAIDRLLQTRERLRDKLYSW
jgi:hypothetical protein